MEELVEFELVNTVDGEVVGRGSLVRGSGKYHSTRYVAL